MPPLQYLATPESIPDKGLSGLKGDSVGNINSNLNTYISGEDSTNNVLMVENQFNYNNITTNATTTIKTGSGLLASFTLNNPGKISVADLVITAYDNTAASGTVIGTWTIPVASATATEQVAPPQILNVKFGTGLTIVTSGPTVPANLTFSYR